MTFAHTLLAHAQMVAHIFSPIVLRLQEEEPLDMLDAARIIRLYVDEMRASNDDIEDFYDLIMVINNMVYERVPEKTPDTQEEADRLIELFDARVYAKKQVKGKFRDLKSGARAYQNLREATAQYFSGVKYVWEPSVAKLVAMGEERAARVV